MLREPAYTVDGETLAIDALRFIVSHQDLIERFQNLTGIDGTNIRDQAKDSAFLVGVLDFILGHEADVIDFADQMGMSPHSIGQARNALAKAAGLPPEEFATPLQMK